MVNNGNKRAIMDKSRGPILGDAGGGRETKV